MGVVMDPIDSIKPQKDTTLALMLEAQARGWQIAYMTMDDLHLGNGRAEGLLRYVRVYNDISRWYEIVSEEYAPLSSLDVILMRKDPPFDMEYIMATYILERAEVEGTLVVNRAQSLRDVNEKVFTAWFPQCCPPTLLTRSKQAILYFVDTHEKAVIKPTGKMGGQSVFVLSKGDPNTPVIIEEITHMETCYVQVQAYLHDIAHTGDKRILLINGVPIEHAIARMPGPGDHRGNLAAGAQAKGITLSERDRWICAEIGPVLRERGLLFVGIDIIGDYLTEINVTSPTGVREIGKYFHTDVPAMLFDVLAQLLESNTTGNPSAR